MVSWRWVFAAGLLLGWMGGTRAEAQRLPGGVRPGHYSLTITPDLRAATFAGSETIDVVLDAPASAITLNAAEIEFGPVKAFVGGAAPGAKRQQQVPLGDDKRPQGAIEQDAQVTLDARKEQATLRFAQALPAGRVTLAIEYQGTLNDKLRGFYLSKTKLRSYGVTQFEATDARRAFPSFDEPALKATFDVALVVDGSDTAISNMGIVSDTPGPVAGKHTVAFATTPKMSTYLVAWLVGDFACSKGKSDGVEIRACSTPDKVGLTRFALDAAKWDLHYYDKYFGIKYPMKKLDMVAIPDFDSGAMENFGCITFRETEMLVDEKLGALPGKKAVVETVAHELAHQWFGDLVTPQWWDNLWLNEGFATWMETKVAAKWQPKWEYDQDAATDLNHILDEDAGRTTRPILARAETPGEINALFDDITYGKAGAVVGMVENWVGEEVFRKGVQAYVMAHLYGNAKAEDFWDAQTRVSGLPVDKAMRSFVEQPGVPEVTVGTPVPNGTPLSQQRFFASTGRVDVNPCLGCEQLQMDPVEITPPSWTIPVCLKGIGCKVVGPNTGMLAAPPSSFLYANAGDKGYYRVRYVPEQLKAILANAETGLTPPERIGLLGERWALMRAGQGTVGDFLDLVLDLKRDPNAAVLESALGKVATIESEIATEEDRGRLDGMVRREFGEVYATLAVKEKHESYAHAELRGSMFEDLGKANDPAILAQAQALTRQALAGQKPADPGILDAAVAVATAKGDVATYESLLRVCRNATDPDLKEAALHALTRFQTPALVTRTLEYAVSDEVRSQDSWTLIALLLDQRETQDQAWEFVQTRWKAIERKSTAGSWARIVEATGSFCSVDKREQVESFFHAHPVESSEMTLAKSIDSIDDCIHLRAAQEPELRIWLDKQAAR